MRNHDRVDSRLDRLAKRGQLHRLKAGKISAYTSHSEMRVGIGITVPRKVLRRCHHAFGVRALDI